jgi:hypothetical protein
MLFALQNGCLDRQADSRSPAAPERTTRVLPLDGGRWAKCSATQR